MYYTMPILIWFVYIIAPAGRKTTEIPRQWPIFKHWGLLYSPLRQSCPNLACESELTANSSMPNFVLINTLYIFLECLNFGAHPSPITIVQIWHARVDPRRRPTLSSGSVYCGPWGAKTPKFVRVFNFNILWWRHLAAQRQSWTRVHNYKLSPSQQCKTISILKRLNGEVVSTVQKRLTKQNMTAKGLKLAVILYFRLLSPLKKPIKTNQTMRRWHWQITSIKRTQQRLRTIHNHRQFY